MPIFVSHASEDRVAALPIIEAINQAGFTAWPSDKPNASRADETEHRIETAQCVIVLWSRAAAASRSVQQEVRQAIQAWSADRLVLALLDDAPLPVGLSDLPAVVMSRDRDTDKKQLISRIQDIVGRDVTAPSTPQPAPSRGYRRWGGFFAGVVFVLLILVSAVLWGQHFAGCGPYCLGAPSTTFPLGFPTAPPQATLPFAYTLTLLALGGAIGAMLVWALRSLLRLRSRVSSPKRAAAQPQHEGGKFDGAAQVFVSYSHRDETTVDQLVKQIEQLGYTVWIDRQLTGSQRYAASIVRAIRASRLVALMCSQHAFASDHVIREIYVAGDSKKPFIAFQLDPTEFPDEVLYFVSGFPRIPIAGIDRQRLDSEIARLVVI
jgi:hypothetical protein